MFVLRTLASDLDTHALRNLGSPDPFAQQGISFERGFIALKRKLSHGSSTTLLFHRGPERLSASPNVTKLVCQNDKVTA